MRFVGFKYLLACILGTFPAITLATNVSGPLTTSTTWTLAASPYVVTGNVLVGTGATLTIEPGVEVRFNKGTYMKVEGHLVVRGNEALPIRFTSNAPSPQRTDWGGIRIRPGAGTTLDGSGEYVAGSVFEHAVLEYAGTALYVYDTGLLARHCRFSANARAVELRHTLNVVLDHNLYRDNTSGIWSAYEDYSGDIVDDIVNTHITDSDFENNGNGIELNMNQRDFEGLRIQGSRFRGNTRAVVLGGRGLRSQGSQHIDSGQPPVGERDGHRA